MATKKSGTDTQPKETPQFCLLPGVPERPLSAGIVPGREALIRYHEKAWVNQTVLHYCFLDTPKDWKGPDKQKKAVRGAFAEWKALGIGLEFVEVASPEDAEIRIGFERGGGSWSYVGRDNVDYVTDPKERTMNFGWDLTTPYGHDTALHEIGHALGFPHEHQNPNAGIVWDEEAVYAHFGGPPNNWDRDKAYYNIIRKISPNAVRGSNWDPDSIMHYQFEAGLILNPEKYQTIPLIPGAGLSPVDIKRCRAFYPPAAKKAPPKLRPFESRLVSLKPGKQLDFVIQPPETRKYTLQTFGPLDAVLVLFEEAAGEISYLSGEDNSGFETNAKIRHRLVRGHTYHVRLRVLAAGEGSIMLW